LFFRQIDLDFQLDRGVMQSIWIPGDHAVHGADADVGSRA
jgi:hypothetical protein